MLIYDNFVQKVIYVRAEGGMDEFFVNIQLLLITFSKYFFTYELIMN
jgi:hypothetical protein